jgi:hypothetical protein
MALLSIKDLFRCEAQTIKRPLRGVAEPEYGESPYRTSALPPVLLFKYHGNASLLC